MNNKYNIAISKQVEKFIRKQDKITQRRIFNAVAELPEGDIKKLKGHINYFRLRVGDIRIIFEKNDTQFIIILVDIGNRGEIYNNY